MTPIYYQPSGKYDPSAPVVFFILVFILSSIHGVIWSWLLTERGLSSAVKIDLLIIYLFLILFLNSLIAPIIVKKLKIRSPEMVFKVGLIAAGLGWVLFNTVTKYKEIKKRLLKLGEVDILLTNQPPKSSLEKSFFVWIIFFIPETDEDEDYYLSLPVLQFSWSDIHREMRFNLKVDYETVVSVVQKFGLDRWEKKYDNLLKRLKIVGEDLPPV